MNFETVGFKSKIFMKSTSLKTKLLESIKNYDLDMGNVPPFLLNIKSAVRYGLQLKIQYK